MDLGIFGKDYQESQNRNTVIKQNKYTQVCDEISAQQLVLYGHLQSYGRAHAAKNK